MIDEKGLEEIAAETEPGIGNSLKGVISQSETKIRKLEAKAKDLEIRYLELERKGERSMYIYNIMDQLKTVRKQIYNLKNPQPQGNYPNSCY